MSSGIKLTNKKEYFSKETETIKKILELKNTNGMKNEFESSGNRAEQMKERISVPEVRNLEMTQVEEIIES